KPATASSQAPQFGQPKNAGSTISTAKTYNPPKITSMHADPTKHQAVLSQGSTSGPVLRQATNDDLIQARFQNKLRQRRISYIPAHGCEGAQWWVALNEARGEVLGTHY